MPAFRTLSKAFDLDQAADSLTFFHGVANLLDPAGMPASAEQTFLH